MVCFRFHFLSGARAAPGVGQLGQRYNIFSDFFTGFQPKMTTLPYRFYNFYATFFKYRDTSEFETFD